MSGWWFSASASSATRFTKAIAARKSAKRNSRSSAPSTSLQPSGVAMSEGMARGSRLPPAIYDRAVVAARPTLRGSRKQRAAPSGAPVRVRLPAARAPRRARAAAAARAAARGRARVGGDRPRGRGRALARAVARGGAAAAAEDGARQRRRPARARRRQGVGARALPRLRVRPARQRGAVRRARVT